MTPLMPITLTLFRRLIENRINNKNKNNIHSTLVCKYMKKRELVGWTHSVVDRYR